MKQIGLHKIDFKKHKLLSITIMSLNHQVFKEKHFFLNATLNSSHYSINILGRKGESFFIFKVG